MKLKYNFIINELGEEFVAVPVADAVIEFNGVLRLNESAAYIIETLNTEIQYEELCEKVANKFKTSVEDAKKSVDNIIGGLKTANLLVE